MRKVKLTDDTERELAQRGARDLGNFLESRRPASGSPFVLEARGGDESEAVLVPSTVAYALLDAMKELGEGRSLLFESVDEELTTQEAAELLQVSRPYLIENILEEGKMAFRKVGNRRRIPISEVKRYKREQRDKRKEVLDELSKEAQELELGYE